MTTWKPIPSFEGCYEVSDLGEIRSIARTVVRKNGSPMSVQGRTIRTRAHPQGYRQVTLVKNGKFTNALVHQVVAAAFIGPRPGFAWVLHFNGDKTDNRHANLRYGSRQDNADDAVRLREMRRGEESHMAKLTDNAVRWIRADPRSQSVIANEYGVSQTLVSQVKRRKIWKHIT